MRCLRRNHGFVLLIAIFMVGIVGAALLVLSDAASSDAHRTIEQARQAQFDQMLLAGAADALARLRSRPLVVGQTWTVDLPPSLAAQDAELRASVTSIANDGEVVLAIRARLDRRSAEQTVRFKHDLSGWRLVAAKLG